MKISEWNEDAPRKAGFEAWNCDDSSFLEKRVSCVPQSIMATKPLPPPNATGAFSPRSIPLGQKFIS